jgi:hypothetical protein
VYTSVTHIWLGANEVDELVLAITNKLLARNLRFRRLLLFDARKMLLSRLCADEFCVLWSYFLTSSGGKDDGSAPDNIDSIRVELAAVDDKRRRRELCQLISSHFVFSFLLCTVLFVGSTVYCDRVVSFFSFFINCFFAFRSLWL